MARQRVIPPEGLEPAGGFLPGDVVIHKGDPDGYEGVVVKVEAAEVGVAPRLRIAPWGSRAVYSPGGSWWWSGTFYLVKRPAPGMVIPSPRAAPAPTGAKDAVLDRDFVLALVEWLDTEPALSTFEVRQRKVAQLINFLGGRWDYGHGVGHSSGEPLDRTVLNRCSSYSDEGCFPSSGYMSDWGRHEPEVIFETLACVMDGWAIDDGAANQPGNRHCSACAADLTYARREGCGHFECVRCGRRQRESCGLCSGISRAEEADHRVRVCSECCDHVFCSCGCDTPASRRYLCPRCSRVTGHCQCSRCERGVELRRHIPACQTHTGGEWEEDSEPCGCGGCATHCGCGAHCFPQTHNDLTFFPAKRGDKGLLRMMGTELETANALKYSRSLAAAVEKWRCNIVTDGSIGPRGMELVTAPAGGSNWVEMISDLGVGFKDSKAVTSDLCGQHVHVDARDVDVYAMRRIIKLYAYTEQCFFDALPFSRHNGQYSKVCGPEYLGWLDNAGKRLNKRWLAAQQYGVSSLESGYYGKDKKEAVEKFDAAVAKQSRQKYNSTRYKALNLHSYWHRGTIEFRHAHGTNNPEQIINWGIVCGSLIDWCVREGDLQLNKLLELQPREALLRIIPVEAAQEWLVGRWAKFTLEPGVRQPREPARDKATGEV